MTCYTIGHSKHTTEEFVSLIKPYGINMVIDVRSIPFSRYAPQFNRTFIQRNFDCFAINYEYMGDVLGGKFIYTDFFNESGCVGFHKVTSNELFQKGNDSVIAKIKNGMNLVLMCTEKDPLYCHRFLLISRELSSRGVKVIHLLADGNAIDNEQLINNAVISKSNSMFLQLDFFSDADKTHQNMVYESLLMVKVKKKS